MSLLVLLKSIFLGIVEGVTEFLPVSSTGHLIIVERYVQLSSDSAFVNGFEVVIQLGAILAVVVLFWKTLWPWASAPAQRPATWRLWLRVLVGIIPAFIAGYLLEGFVTTRLFNPLVVSIALAFYGVVLIVVERLLKGRQGEPLPDIRRLSLWGAFAIGLFQTLALVPGTSRSAATIIGGMILGLGRGAAAEFSFFLAVPVMVGASGLTLMKHGLHFAPAEWVTLLVGFVAAFLSALVVLRAFLRYLRAHDFVVFGWYRIALGCAVLLLLVVLG